MSSPLFKGIQRYSPHRLDRLFPQQRRGGGGRKWTIGKNHQVFHSLFCMCVLLSELQESGKEDTRGGLTYQGQQILRLFHSHHYIRQFIYIGEEG